mgnify:CR=1 FL=1
MTAEDDTGGAEARGARQEARWLGLSERQLALILLFVAPVLFCSNMLTARLVHDSFPPVALAFWRWSLALCLLLPFTGAALWRHRRAALKEWRDLLILGALGMGACGAFRGEVGVLMSLSFAVGDFWIVGAMAAWAVYCIMLQHRATALPMMARFAAIVTGGILVLLPFTIAEGIGIAGLGGELPALEPRSFLIVAFLAVVPSFGAYQVYGLVQRILGAGPTSLLMYLFPLYNGVLAYLLLGEQLRSYHLIGAALVLPGIFLATRRRA